MYDRVYPVMVDEKVATSLEKWEYYFVNRYGSRVNKEEVAARHQIEHRLSNTQYAIFGDEVGTDTNYTEDGNNDVSVT